ncbi:MAG: hypothetical protein BV459_00515 [Thermoplasmata archaeon M11B2D]|nr:MAG: hypothetical protein BV459_00515 [Thermoplasmata archaeon M11B2D]
MSKKELVYDKFYEVRAPSGITLEQTNVPSDVIKSFNKSTDADLFEYQGSDERLDSDGRPYLAPGNNKHLVAKRRKNKLTYKSISCKFMLAE